MYRDLIDVVEQAGAHLDTILIPKVGVPGDVYTVDALLTQLEQALGLSPPDRCGGSGGDRSGDGQCRGGGGVEPAAGGAALRGGGLRGVVPGPDDHHRRAQSRLSGRPVALGAVPHAGGLPRQWAKAIDGPFGDFGDPEGFTAGARRAAALGYDGKWAIHPAQIDLANEVFTPPESEVDQARRVLRALEEAAAAGRGAAQLDGRMIDAASARMARNQRVIEPDRTSGAGARTQGGAFMEIHEYQAKAILADYGVAIPEGGLAYSPEQATYRASEIGGERWVVKAQVHCGDRGQAGGIKICSHEREIWEAADELLGKRLVTPQTGEQGKGVYRLYVEAPSSSERELYLGFVLDRAAERVMVVALSRRGMESKMIRDPAIDVSSCGVNVEQLSELQAVRGPGEIAFAGAVSDAISLV
ncbi:Probable malate--CoA ligase subunit beta [Geodia barretti]|uniref:Probable malate--CoA ligase subunit beta n=1 Tax=Geodia barretti TaxID=519541 RepID=A0AA35T9C3_GEOBA|nr:Probable malate--CoA ligase subunit beta [Geodia barretti]